tara:strand:- start:642 stop:1088 length:447 start_codon:yes stop_codon:yes gene_type:complete
MRHRHKTKKLQRNKSQRRALLSNQACSLIHEGKIETTLAKAKALRPVVEKMVTLGKKGISAESKGETAKGVHYRRQAFAFLRQKKAVQSLFGKVANAALERKGGYTRITKLGPRQSDSALMAQIGWVDTYIEPKATEETPATESEATA